MRKNREDGVTVVREAIELFREGTHPKTFLKIYPSLDRLANSDERKELSTLKKEQSKHVVKQPIEIIDSNKATHYIINSGTKDEKIIRVRKGKKVD